MSSEEAAKSATPSVAPRTSVLAPGPDVRNNGSTAKMASELTSVRKLTTPKMTTSRGIPRNSLEVPGALVAVEGRANVLLWIIRAVGRENGQ